jgi:hypothetical protein
LKLLGCDEMLSPSLAIPLQAVPPTSVAAEAPIFVPQPSKRKSKDFNTSADTAVVVSKPKGKARQAKRSTVANASGDTNVAASTPDGPLTASNPHSLLRDVARIGDGEKYGEDERALNKILSTVPMLSSEATSMETFQLVSSMFDKSALRLNDEIVVIPKSYDDASLRPPKVRERECVLGKNCVCRVLASLRHGDSSPLAFVCTEFLLPEERAKFNSGEPLPVRRKKCLLCTRYFTHFLYVSARTDPGFKLENMQLQSFGNVVASMPSASDAPTCMAELKQSMENMPHALSNVSTRDGYLSSAMLYVDEGFVNDVPIARREFATLAWKPVVRFAAKDYRFVNGPDGPCAIQVGIGVPEPNTDLHFCRPPLTTA